jgi:uncharacterized coiled-coil protein SlyX
MAFLRFVAAGAEDEAQVPLGEWQREEIVPELAGELVELLDQHAVEMGSHITATLAYVASDGSIVQALTLKRQANHVVAGEGTGLMVHPEDMNAQLTGDARSQASQAQKHLEVMGRVYMSGMAGLLAHSERLVTRQSEMLETLANRLGRSERRIDQKEQELADLVEAMREARESGGEAASPAMERAFQMLERLAPHLIGQFVASQQAGGQKASE